MSKTVNMDAKLKSVNNTRAELQESLRPARILRNENK